MCNTCGCKNAESFEAEGARTLTIKGVRYIGDEMRIEIEMERMRRG